MICAYLIIALHTISPDGVGFYLKLIGRVGVPIFAICSGFLIANQIQESTKENNKYIFKYCFRLLFLEAMWSIPYLLLDHDIYFATNAWYKDVYSIIVVFWKRGISMHMWYLSALVVCVLILYILIPRVNKRFILIISSCLYVFCLFGDNYYGLIKDTVIAAVIDGYIARFGNVWNSFMSILLFVYMGVLLREKWEQKSLPHLSTKMIVFVLFLFYVENTILHISEISLDNSASITLIPLSIGIIILGLQLSNKIKKPLPFVRASMYIYLVHVFVIRIVDFCWKYSGEFIASCGRFLIVAVITTFVSIFICIGKEYLLQKKKISK